MQSIGSSDSLSFKPHQPPENRAIVAGEKSSTLALLTSSGFASDTHKNRNFTNPSVLSGLDGTLEQPVRAVSGSFALRADWDEAYLRTARAASDQKKNRAFAGLYHRPVEPSPCKRKVINIEEVTQGQPHTPCKPVCVKCNNTGIPACERIDAHRPPVVSGLHSINAFLGQRRPEKSEFSPSIISAHSLCGNSAFASPPRLSSRPTKHDDSGALSQNSKRSVTDSTNLSDSCPPPPSVPQPHHGLHLPRHSTKPLCESRDLSQTISSFRSLDITLDLASDFAKSPMLYSLNPVKPAKTPRTLLRLRREALGCDDLIASETRGKGEPVRRSPKWCPKQRSPSLYAKDGFLRNACDDPVLVSSNKVCQPGHKLWSTVTTNTTNNVNVKYDAAVDNVAWYRKDEEEMGKGTRIKLSESELREPKRFCSRAFLMHPNLSLSSLVSSKEREANEQKRLRVLQKSHHDMKVIENGGRELMDSFMKSSASLANSLSNFQRWKSSIRDGSFTLASSQGPISTTPNAKNSNHGKVHCEQHDSESLGYKTSQSMEKAHNSPQAFNNSFVESLDNTKLLPYVKEQNKASFIIVDLEEKTRSDSSCVNSSTCSGSGSLYKKTLEFGKAGSADGILRLPQKCKDNYQDPSRFVTDSENDDDEAHCFSFYSYTQKPKGRDAEKNGVFTSPPALN